MNSNDSLYIVNRLHLIYSPNSEEHFQFQILYLTRILAISSDAALETLALSLNDYKALDPISIKIHDKF